MKTNYDLILARYFGGNASEEDMNILEQWIQSAPENEAEFVSMSKLYAQLGGIAFSNMPNPQTKRNKEKFFEHINATTKQHIIHKQAEKKSIPFLRWVSVAASIIIITVLSIKIWESPVAPSNDEIIVATQLQNKKTQLPDKTTVLLSKNSRIRYKSSFAKGTKSLQLEGEATFDVQHHGNGQLQVNAGETIIEDIGTIFKVSAHKDSNIIKVNVSQGQVHFYTKDNKGVVVNANETGIYNKSTKQFKLLIPTAETLAQTGMHVHFQAMLMKDVADIISKAYKIKIKFSDSKIENRQITVSFDGENLELILQVIAETLEVDVNKTDYGYLLKSRE
jgi:ferric-dicitrate binding protein FerR (iron transport regulator)